MSMATLMNGPCLAGSNKSAAIKPVSTSSRRFTVSCEINVGKSQDKRSPTVSRDVSIKSTYNYAAAAGYQMPTDVQQADPTTSSTGRKIVFAVDGTQEAEEGLRWLSQQVARKNDTIHLVHVIIDGRTPSTAVGSSTAATQWTPVRDEQVYAREFFLRKEHEAQTMMNSRFVPSLQFSGVSHEVDLLRLRVHKSAGGIGEAICNRACDIGADFVVIASHGAGVLAEFGSVARWCMENSSTPVMLIPPPILRKDVTVAPSNAVLVAATDNLQGLHNAFDFALQNLVRPGDGVYAMHIQRIDSEEAGIAARKQLVADVLQWQAESKAPHAATVNVAVDIISENATHTGGPEGESPSGAKVCEYAKELNARAVVLNHHGKSMMREMMYSPVTVQVTKFCSSPLVVLGAQE